MLKKVFRNMLFMLSQQGLNKLLFVVLVAVIARLLGPGALGDYGFAFAFEYMLMLLVGLVAQDLIIREMSSRKQLVPKVVGNVMIFNAAVMILLLVPALFFSNMLDDSSTLPVIVMLVWIEAFINSFNSLFYSVFRAYEKMQYEALSLLIHDIVVAAGSVAVILSGFGIMHVILMFILGKVVSFAFSSLILIRRFPKPSFNLDTCFCKHLVYKSVPFIGGGLAFIMILKLDVMLLVFMKGNAAAGIYQSAYTIIQNIGLLSMTLVISIFPLFSRLHGADKTALYSTYKRAFKYVICGNMALLAILVAFSAFIVDMLYGPQFSEAGKILPLLAIGGFFCNISMLNGCLLNAMRKEMNNVWFAFAAAAANIILNLALIPKFSYYGAAAAIALTFALLFAIQLVPIARAIKEDKPE